MKIKRFINGVEIYGEMPEIKISNNDVIRIIKGVQSKINVSE